MKDSHGNRMTVPYGWAFRTGDYTPPEVVATNPAGEEQEGEGQGPASPDVVLTITFDERLDEMRLDEVEFSLVGPGGAVSGTLAVQAAMGLQTVLGFTPDEVLTAEAHYTATVVGAVDLVGNVMVEAHEWAFNTGSGGGGGGIHSGTAERVRQSYAFGGKPVAIREQLGEAESVYWLHPDHLGSTTLVTNEDGEKAAERRYLPWGEERYVDAEMPTDRLYTGQIKDRYINIYDYGARRYDQNLGRFLSPDTIIPQQDDPQQLNRYAYARNNALRYTDPTGHWLEPGIYQGEEIGDTYYAGYSVLDRRPEVQAYLDEAMDPIHFLDPIKATFVGGLLGGLVGDFVGLAFPGLDLAPTYIGGRPTSGLPVIPQEAPPVGNHYAAGSPARIEQEAMYTVGSVTKGPRSPRIEGLTRPGQTNDIFIGGDGLTIPGQGGASVFNSPEAMGKNVSGTVYRLPAGAPTPGFGYLPAAPPPGHGLLSPYMPMAPVDCVNAFHALGWQRVPTMQGAPWKIP